MTMTTTLRTSAAALERALGSFHLDAMASASAASSSESREADEEMTAVQYFGPPEDARLLRCEMMGRLLEADEEVRSAEDDGVARRVNGDGDGGGAEARGLWVGDEARDDIRKTPILGIGPPSRPPPQAKKEGDNDLAVIANSSAAERVEVSLTLGRYEDGGEGPAAGGGDWRRKGGAAPSLAGTDQTDGFHKDDDGGSYDEEGAPTLPPRNGAKDGFETRVSVRLVDATPAGGLHSDPSPAGVHSLLRTVLRCQGAGSAEAGCDDCDANGHCSSPWSFYYRPGNGGNGNGGLGEQRSRRRHRPCPCGPSSVGNETDHSSGSPRRQPGVVGIVVRGELSGGSGGDGDAVEDSSPTATASPSPDLVEEMMKFRVGDVAPSFHLHSAAPLLLSSSPSPSLAGRGVVDGDENEDDAVTSALRAFFIGGKQLNGSPRPSSSSRWLFVYRQLPQRHHVQHRLSDFSRKFGLSRPGDDRVDGAGGCDDDDDDGCLWEAYLSSAAAPHSSPDEYGLDDELDEDGEPMHIVRYRRVSPPYVDWVETYGPLLRHLLIPENFKAMREEVLSIPQWTPWPEDHYDADGGSDWTVFPLCHTFPATEPRNRKWIRSTCGFCPRTVELLQHDGMLGGKLRTALFSRLGPRTLLAPHTGWEDLANHVLRVHLPLVVPPGGHCGTWVDGCVETHREGEILAFDDSKVHRAFNNGDGERLVLIVDLERPADLPVGTAVGGHTEELDAFIRELT